MGSFVVKAFKSPYSQADLVAQMVKFLMYTPSPQNLTEVCHTTCTKCLEMAAILSHDRVHGGMGLFLI